MAKNSVSSRGSQKENPVIQMVNVRALKKEIKIWDLPGHDQKDKSSGENEGQDESDQRDACQLSRVMIKGGLREHSCFLELLVRFTDNCRSDLLKKLDDLSGVAKGMFRAATSVLQFAWLLSKRLSSKT
jgi:hypothetical protein